MPPLAGALPRERTGTEQLSFMIGTTELRSRGPEPEHRWVDVACADLIRDPMAAVRDIHERFPWPPEQTTIDDMNAWPLRQAEQRCHEIRHSCRLEGYALTPETANRASSPISISPPAKGSCRTNCLLQ